ncbi:MAG: hypothetical protein SFW67_25960 [Myxococcaceae bacterium]|nr:hypothetical protein [Myxococcaceae bacterium]
MRRLLREVFAYLKKQANSKMKDEDLLKLTKKVIARMETGVGPATWEGAAPVRIHALRRPTSLWRPFRIVGHITELRDPELVLVPDGNGKFSQDVATCLKIVGPDGDSIHSVDVVGAEVETIHAAREAGGMVEFLVTPIALPIRLDRKRPDQSIGGERQSFFVHIVDVRQSNSMLDLLGATATERSDVQSLLLSLHARGIVPTDYLFDFVVKELRIVSLDELPRLRDALRFAVLQALSCGQVDHAPGRLHGMIVGPPGHGKKLIGLAARALNPVAVELSPSKASPAGLVGASSRREGTWFSQPGALIHSDHGVAVLQDAHGWQGAELRKLAPILQEVTEDGRVRDTVAGGRTRSTNVAMLLDLNRTAQVTTASIIGAPEAAILRVRPVLSRFDLLLEIPEDIDRIWNAAARLYESIQGGAADLDRRPGVREARLLVALLRDRNPDVDLDPVRDLMKAVHRNLHSTNAALFEDLPEASDVPTRLAISFARYVSAAARGRDADVAAPSDVDTATRFLNHKLSFLRMHGSSYPGAVNGQASAEDRDAWFKQYAGQEVRTQDVVNDFKAKTGEDMSERTGRRNLLRLGAKRTGKGRYLLPPGEPPRSGGQ